MCIQSMVANRGRRICIRSGQHSTHFPRHQIVAGIEFPFKMALLTGMPSFMPKRITEQQK